jgi:hypothetical protein
MDYPIAFVVVPGLIGGAVLALAFFLMDRRSSKPSVRVDPFKEFGLSTDVINMANIRVAGVGGLGLVAMAVIVAYTRPEIGDPLAVCLLLGIVFAIVLIGGRRRKGPMPSSGRSAGAHALLSIDTQPRSGK